MYCTTQMIFALMSFVCNVEGTQYVFANQSETWGKAREVCSENGFRLSYLNQSNIGAALHNCSLDGVTDLWTDTFLYTTPHLSLVGCFSKNDMPTKTLKDDSLIECQILCEEYPRLAIMKNECACLSTDYNLGTMSNSQRCSYICDDVRCGGKDAVNVYEIVNVSSFVGEEVFSPHVSLSCLVYQCVNNSIYYQEKDCTENNIEVNTDYFSCTFEPEDDCFLVQPTWDDFDWSVQNTSLGYRSVYEPSYYAYAASPGGGPNQKATLISSTNFKASTWCLRFRYLASLPTLMDVTLLDIIKNENKYLIKIRNATNTSFTNPDWYYVEVSIIRENDFNLMFIFEESNLSSNIALDDVSMLVGNCNKTLTELLNQRGKLQCTFGGNTDMCFRQDTMNWVYKNNQAVLFQEVNQSSVLISAFEFQDNYQNKTREKQQRPVPDPSVLSTSDLSNARCISDGPYKYTDTIRLQGKYLPLNGVPSEVLIYRTKDSTVYWDKVKPTTKRLFVCEKNTGVVNSCEDHFSKRPINGARRPSEENGIAWIIAIVASSIIVLTMVVVIVVFKWGYIKGLCKKNTSAVQTENTPDLYLDVIKSTSSYETLEIRRSNTAEGTYEHLHPEPATVTPYNEYVYITENAYENK